VSAPRPRLRDGRRAQTTYARHPETPGHLDDVRLDADGFASPDVTAEVTSNAAETFAAYRCSTNVHVAHAEGLERGNHRYVLAIGLPDDTSPEVTSEAGVSGSVDNVPGCVHNFGRLSTAVWEGSSKGTVGGCGGPAIGALGTSPTLPNQGSVTSVARSPGSQARCPIANR
jgi:hypothetical protein